MKRTTAQLISEMEREGFLFKNFSLTHEGAYAVEDADWNYKDVPHLHHIHALVESIIASVGDSEIATINVQKVLGVRFPLALFNYQSAPNAQTYYTTWLVFVLIIESAYEALGPNRTRVRTTYHLGAPRGWGWCFPLIRWVLMRNYRALMADDLPMRERRGQLRDWGYSFKKRGVLHSFEDTMDISVSNVVAPAGLRSPSLRLRLDRELADGEFLVGRDDHVGLRLVREGNALLIFPRLCPHEGASLDGQRACERTLRCPWHGRLLRPLGTLDLRQPGSRCLTECHEIRVDSGAVTVAPREGA